MRLHLKISAEDKKKILSFAETYQKDTRYFIPNGPSRQFSVLNKIEHEIKNDALRIWKQKYNELGIDKFSEEPLFGLFLGVNNQGGFVHEHTDPAPEGFYHTRINFLLSKPKSGGLPIYNGQVHNYDEDDSWLNLANVWKHSSTPVLGKKDRVVLSLGALVKREIIDKFIKEYKNVRNNL